MTTSLPAGPVVTTAGPATPEPYRVPVTFAGASSQAGLHAAVDGAIAAWSNAAVIRR